MLGVTSAEIDFLGLPSCFKWYQGGIYVQGPTHLDRKWINCFYSEEQAMQARQMMEDVVLKKYDWDTTRAKLDKTNCRCSQANI